MPTKPTYEELERKVQELEKAGFERKHFEEKLSHSYQWMEYIITYARSAIAVHDKDLNYLYVSKRYLEEYKVKDSNVIGRHHYEVFPDLPQKWKDVHQRALKGEVVSAEDDPYYREDGSVDWTRWECRPWYDVNGSIGGIIVYTEVINDRRQIEKDLEKSAARLTQAQQMAKIGYWDYTIATGELSWSDEVYDIFKCDRKSFNPSKESIETFIHPDDYRVFLKERDAVLKEHRSMDFEHRIILSGGSTRYVHELAEIITDTKKNAIAISGTVQDITDKKQAEQDIVESEEMHRQLFESMMDAYSSVDNEGKIIDTNASFNEMLGYTPAELQGLSVKAITPERWHLFESKILEQVLNRGYSDIYEKEYIHKNGSIFPVELRIFLLRDKQGEPTGTWAIVRDITERKKSEQKIVEMESYQQALLDAVLDTLFLMKPDGTILFANDGLAKSMDMPVSELIGKKASELIPGEVEAERRTALDEALNSGEPVTFNDSQTGSDIESRFFPIKDAQDKVTHVAIFARDITELKKAEMEREELRSQLSQSQKMESIGTLAGGIAHDFNNLLVPIMLNAEMAIEDLPNGDPLQDSMKEIHRAGMRARDLVKQILTFARKNSESRIVLKSSPIVNEAIKFLRSTIPTTIDIKCNIKVIQDSIMADPSQLNQIIMNLCTNAAHAMKENGGVLEVILDNETVSVNSKNKNLNLKPGNYLKLTVKDTGTGIPDDIMTKIYEPYYTTKKTGEGSGLGLATVHGIVKKHAGDIIVESEIGQGTTFHVYFPLVDMKIPDVNEQKLENLKGTERVLLVDDEKIIVNVTEKILERLGYNVTSRTSSIEALETFRVNPEKFDLIITDMTMPNMTGADLAKELILIKSEIPVILCTGFSDKINEWKAKEIGISSFVMKPIVMSEMAKTIREVLDKK